MVRRSRQVLRRINIVVVICVCDIVVVVQIICRKYSIVVGGGRRSGDKVGRGRSVGDGLMRWTGWGNVGNIMLAGGVRKCIVDGRIEGDLR